MNSDLVFGFQKKRIFYSLFAILLAVCGTYLFKLDKNMRSPIHSDLNDAMTDYVSNIYSAILFWDEGFDIYRKSPRDLLPLVPAPENLSLARQMHWSPDQIFLRGTSSFQALFISTAQLTRGYPPGCFLLSAPAALLVLYTDIDPNLIANWLLIVFSFFAFLTCAEIARVAFSVALLSCHRTAALLGVGVLVLGLTMQMVYWAGRGIYDPVALFFLVKAFQFKAAKRWDLSLLFYAISLFLHFRSIWFFPLPLFCLWEGIRQMKTPEFSVRTSKVMLINVSVAIILGLVSCYALLVLKMHSQSWPVSNFMFLGAAKNANPFLDHFFIYAIVLGLVGYCILTKVASGAVFAVSLLLLWSLTPQFAQWHSLFLAPFLLIFSEKKRMLDLFIGFLFFYALSDLIFANSPFDNVAIKKFIGVLLS